MTVEYGEISAEFRRRIEAVVYASASTVDTKGRTRVRVLHPVWDWERHVAWIGTNPQGAIASELGANPHLSLCYLISSLDPIATEQVYVDCVAEWVDRQATWEIIKSGPPPVGYDPAVSWQSPDDPKFGALKLTPWRIELSALSAADGWSQSIWRRQSG